VINNVQLGRILDRASRQLPVCPNERALIAVLAHEVLGLRSQVRGLKRSVTKWRALAIKLGNV
jgi:hypothetical protein